MPNPKSQVPSQKFFDEVTEVGLMAGDFGLGIVD
jgi:hypothetical protein